MSKGDTYRPVNKERYDRNYERIFGQKKEEEVTVRSPQELSCVPCGKVTLHKWSDDEYRCSQCGKVFYSRRQRHEEETDNE